MLSGRVSAIYGGGQNSGATVTGNTNITMSNGFIVDSVAGTHKGDVVGSTYINISGGEVRYIKGAGNPETIDGDTNVTVSGTAKIIDIYGGSVGSGAVTGKANTTISGGTITGVVHGGSYVSGRVGSTNVTITGGTMGDVFGGGPVKLLF